MSNLKQQKTSFGNDKKKITSFFAVILLLTAGGLTLARPQTAGAQLGPQVPTLDEYNLIQNTVTAKSSATVASKETLWDAIAKQAAQVTISNITSSIVSWINSGFRGSPAFVTDPAGFLTDTADQIAGNFIAGTELGFICDPFELNVRAALNLNYSSSFAKRNFCRLSGAVSNVENFAKFTAGDFSQGGWDSWFQITQNPQNNPLGVYLASKSELTDRIFGAQSIELLKLDWGNGFLSWRECIASNMETGECAEYSEIKTPGSVIENQLNNTLFTGTRQLELADEFNEIVGALIGQLVNTVLTQGLSSFGSGGSNQGSLGSGTSPLSVWCTPNTSVTSLSGGSVVWTAGTFGGLPGAPTYLWSGEEINGAITSSVTASYSTSGFKTAAVRVTKGGQNLFRNCNSGVLVE